MMKDIRTLPISAVDIRDEFWRPRRETNRLVTLGHTYNHLKANGCLDNFRRVIGEAGGEFEGPMFLDANAYKWIEAASYALATVEIPSLRENVNEVVSLIERTQAEDGYLCTYFMVAEQDKRWTNFNWMHELYCAGHLIEAAVARRRTTGERDLLEVACRFAGHIDERFGPGQREIIPGHEEIELALVKLFEETGERRYLQLAATFVDRRGQEPSPMADEIRRLEEIGGSEIEDRVLLSTEAAKGVFLNEEGSYDGRFAQDHTPVREQQTVEGHAVRATYLYAAVAALLQHLDDPSLFAAVERLWENMARKRTYVTGGIGSTADGESFTEDYDLPNDTACAETCAAVGSIRWCRRMFELTGEAKYVDLLERTLYNGLLTGVSLDGRRFSYVNPLEADGDYQREEWFYIACCPPNLARTLASLERYIYAVSDGSETLYINLYVESSAETTIADRSIELVQRTDYPWNGTAEVELSLMDSTEFAVGFRIPEWTQAVDIEVNGRSVAADRKDGYAVVRREWDDGDRISVSFPMQIDVLVTHPAVKNKKGRVALRRGPLVYCVEAADNDRPVHHLTLADPDSLTARHEEGLLGGITVIDGKATVEDIDGWENYLYRSIDAVETEQVQFTAIPYYAWNNRESGPMTVWLQRA